MAQRGCTLWSVQAFRMLAMKPVTREKIEFKKRAKTPLPLDLDRDESDQYSPGRVHQLVRKDIYSHRLQVILVCFAFAKDICN